MLSKLLNNKPLFSFICKRFPSKETTFIIIGSLLFFGTSVYFIKKSLNNHDSNDSTSSTATHKKSKNKNDPHSSSNRRRKPKKLKERIDLATIEDISSLLKISITEEGFQILKQILLHLDTLCCSESFFQNWKPPFYDSHGASSAAAQTLYSASSVPVSPEKKGIINKEASSSPTASVISLGCSSTTAATCTKTATVLIPEFNEQKVHIYSILSLAKIPKQVLLIEGAPGIGKGTTLLQFVKKESRFRPVVYINLSQILGKVHGSSSWVNVDIDSIEHVQMESLSDSQHSSYIEAKYDDDDVDETSSSRKQRFMSCILEGFGIYHVDEYFIDEALGMIHDALYIYHTWNDKVPKNDDHIGVEEDFNFDIQHPVLVIDDFQMLFGKFGLDTAHHEHVEEILEWFVEQQRKNLLDVILCTSAKSVLGALCRIKGYGMSLTYKTIGPVSGTIFADYLRLKVNHFIGEKHKKFTFETADLFALYFDGNLNELQEYMKCPDTVQDFIGKRQTELTQSFDQVVQTLFCDSQRKSDLISLILDMILKNGNVTIESLDRGKFEMAEILVQNNFMRWKAETIPEIKPLGLTSSDYRGASSDTQSSQSKKSVGSTSGQYDDIMEIPDIHLSNNNDNSQSSIYNNKNNNNKKQSTSSLDLNWNAGEITWYNPLRGAICEQWFNEYGYLSNC